MSERPSHPLTPRQRQVASYVNSVGGIVFGLWALYESLWPLGVIGLVTGIWWFKLAGEEASNALDTRHGSREREHDQEPV